MDEVLLWAQPKHSPRLRDFREMLLNSASSAAAAHAGHADHAANALLQRSL